MENISKQSFWEIGVFNHCLFKSRTLLYGQTVECSGIERGSQISDRSFPPIGLHCLALIEKGMASFIAS